MADIVNSFFHKFYPPSWALNEPKYEQIGSYFGCIRDVPGYRKIFPHMVCADGFSMSVQGHFGGYSRPKEDFSEEYIQVEVFCLSAADPLLNEWENQKNDRMGMDRTQTAGIDAPCGYVPVSLVIRIIESHGGLREALELPPTPVERE